MKKESRTYWKGIEQLKNDKEFIKNAQNEFPEYYQLMEAQIILEEIFLK